MALDGLAKFKLPTWQLSFCGATPNFSYMLPVSSALFCRNSSLNHLTAALSPGRIRLNVRSFLPKYSHAVLRPKCALSQNYLPGKKSCGGEKNSVLVIF